MAAGLAMLAGTALAQAPAWPAKPIRMIAGHLAGWAGDAVLDAYEIERLPITDQVSRFAMNHAQQMMKVRGAVPPRIEEPGPEGDAIRAEEGRKSYELNVQQFCCAGLNFGYFYDSSPQIAYDGEAPQDYDMGSFTLLRFEASAEAQPLMDAAAARAVPITLLDLAGDNVPPQYRHALVRVHADQHVAWRSNTAPADAGRLIDQLRGARLCAPGNPA